jgi:hypothetical protein
MKLRAQEWAESIAANPRHSAYNVISQLEVIEHDLSLLGKLRYRSPSVKNSQLGCPSPLKDYSSYVPVRQRSQANLRDLSADSKKSAVDSKFKELQAKTKGLDQRSRQFETDMMSIKRKIKLEQRSLMQLKVRRGDHKMSRQMQLILGKLSTCYLRTAFQQLKQADERSVRRERRIVRRMEQYRAGAVFKHWSDSFLRKLAEEAALTNYASQALNKRRSQIVLRGWHRLTLAKDHRRALSKTVCLDSRPNDKKPTPMKTKGSRVMVASIMRVSPTWLHKVRKFHSPLGNRRFSSQIVMMESSPVPSSQSTSPSKTKILAPKIKPVRLRALRSHSATELAESVKLKQADGHYHKHLAQMSLSRLTEVLKEKSLKADLHFQARRLIQCFQALKPESKLELQSDSFNSTRELVVEQFRLTKAALPLLQAWKSYSQTSRQSRQREQRQCEMQAKVNSWLKAHSRS